GELGRKLYLTRTATWRARRLSPLLLAFAIVHTAIGRSRTDHTNSFGGGGPMSSVKVLNESVISLIEARELLPFPVSLSTVKHWVRVGFRGIVLESARIGWRRVTSRESVARF